MSLVRGGYRGQQVRGYDDQMALARMDRNQIRRARAMEMYVMRRAGIPVKQIAFKYRLTVQYVYQEIASIPEDQRGRIEQFGMEGVRAPFEVA